MVGGGGLSTSVVAVELSLPPMGSVSGLLLTLAVLEIGPLAAGAFEKGRLKFLYLLTNQRRS